MTPSPLPLLLAVVGGVVYHLSQKAVPASAAPFVVVGAAYVTGALVCAAVVLAGGAPTWETLRTAWRPAVGVGLGALAIEAGFLLAYRAGWPLASASLSANVAVALVLLAVGVIGLGEALTPRQWAGVACCLAGLALVTVR